MSQISFDPLGTKELSTGMLICNSNTGEIMEIVQTDGFALKMKSLFKNTIVTMLTKQMQPENWVICSME
jgi:hypothetical protein